MNFAITGFKLCAAIAALACVGSASQDPSDPLLTAPNMVGGSRLQFGKNIFPATWSYAGKLKEPVSEDITLPNFKIEYVAGAKSNPGEATREFEEIPCEFFGTTPIVTVIAQNGERHKFSLDTGALSTYIRPAIAAKLNGGQLFPFPMVLQCGSHTWVHFRVGVSQSIAILRSDNLGFPADGILGMNAVACMQLKIDYQRRKLWARISSKPLEKSLIERELTSSTPSVSIPITKQDSGRYSIETQINGHALPLELDTGASIMGLNRHDAASLNLESVGSGAVLVEGGARTLKRYLATSVNLMALQFPWPIIHEADTSDSDIGGFGPSVLPHQTVIIDYPGLKLHTLIPTTDEWVTQALGQMISGTVAIDNNGVVLDMPDVVGKTRAMLTKVQAEPVASVIATLRSWISGNAAAKSKLLELYRQLNTKGRLTIVQGGETKLIEISP